MPTFRVTMASIANKPHTAKTAIFQCVNPVSGTSVSRGFCDSVSRGRRCVVGRTATAMTTSLRLHLVFQQPAIEQMWNEDC